MVVDKHGSIAPDMGSSSSIVKIPAAVVKVFSPFDVGWAGYCTRSQEMKPFWCSLGPLLVFVWQWEDCNGVQADFLDITHDYHDFTLGSAGILSEFIIKLMRGLLKAGNWLKFKLTEVMLLQKC